MPHTSPTHAGAMTLLQLSCAAAVVLGVLVVALVAIVPHVLDLPGRHAH